MLTRLTLLGLVFGLSTLSAADSPQLVLDQDTGISLREGFDAELLYEVPKSQGSWVAMAFDPKGQLIVSDQDDKGAFRVTLPTGQAGIKVESLPGFPYEPVDWGKRKVGGALGFLYAFDSLYMANMRGFYRIRDTDGDDQFDEFTLLKKLNVGYEHSAHSIIPTADGKGLYLVSGNFTPVPEGTASVKFNIPLDLRTPSYTDCSDAAQASIPEMWKREFWTEYFDAMARHRYNVLSLWSLHPFPSLVKVPEFPEVALDDVWRTRAELDDTFSFAGTDMVRPAMLANHEVVKRMSMDEKIEFWRWVMQQAADCGIRVYVFTWNVFTFGAEGKHGITNDLGNDITKKYFRASVREMVKNYPLLAGMGITAGEGMPHAMDSKAKEAWLWDTYGEGVRDALKNDPQREFGMIHRFHWTAQSEILDAFKDYPGPFEFSFKYSVAHMYSITKPLFIQPLLENLAPGRKTWLTVRNVDSLRRYRSFAGLAKPCA